MSEATRPALDNRPNFNVALPRPLAEYHRGGADSPEDTVLGVRTARGDLGQAFERGEHPEVTVVVEERATFKDQGDERAVGEYDDVRWFGFSDPAQAEAAVAALREERVSPDDHEYVVRSREAMHQIGFAERLSAQTKEVVGRAAGIMTGTSEADPLKVFAPAGPLRAADKGVELTDPQERRTRETVAEIGWGRRTDRRASHRGLRDGDMAVTDGGKWNMVGREIFMTMEDKAALPSTLIVGATDQRKLTDQSDAGRAELETTSRLLGVPPEELVGKTEREITIMGIQRMEDFEALDEPVTLGLGYEVSGDFRVIHEATGQFVQLGVLGAERVPVIIMRMDRYDLPGGGYRQPDRVKVASDILAVTNSDERDTSSTGIAFVTSATYEPSRACIVARVGVETGRRIAVTSYGTESQAALVGKNVALGPINQLPGELNRTEEVRRELDEALAAV